MNKIIVIGNLTRDAEETSTSSGRARVSFSVAVGRRWSRDDEPQTDFFNCIYWGDRASKVHPYLKKGKKVLVEGEMLSRRYTDRDGIDRLVWDINVSNIELLSPAEKRNNDDEEEEPRKEEPKKKKPQVEEEHFDEDDDIPF